MFFWKILVIMTQSCRWREMITVPPISAGHPALYNDVGQDGENIRKRRCGQQDCLLDLFFSSCSRSWSLQRRSQSRPSVPIVDRIFILISRVEGRKPKLFYVTTKSSTSTITTFSLCVQSTNAALTTCGKRRKKRAGLSDPLVESEGMIDISPR